MSTVQLTDQLLIERSTVQYLVPASELIADPSKLNDDIDLVVVERDDIVYKATIKEVRDSLLQATDQLMIERSGTVYRVTAADLETFFNPPGDQPPPNDFDEDAIAYILAVEEAITESSIIGRVRARDAFGRFLADDPITPENEAWIDQT